jgi:hypothetical protein
MSHFQFSHFFISGYGRIYPDMAGYGRIWPDMAGYGRIWPDMAGYGRIWPDVGLQWPWPPEPGTLSNLRMHVGWRPVTRAPSCGAANISYMRYAHVCAICAYMYVLLAACSTSACCASSGSGRTVWRVACVVAQQTAANIEFGQSTSHKSFLGGITAQHATQLTASSYIMYTHAARRRAPRRRTKAHTAKLLL